MHETPPSASSAARQPGRLRSSRQYRLVYERGLKFHTPYFSLFILPMPGDTPRVGLTVTRKIGGAVVRNRCKRRLREIARQHTLSVLGGAGCDLVINARPALVAAGFEQIGAAYLQALERYCAWRARHESSGDGDSQAGDSGKGERKPDETGRDLPLTPL